MLEHPPAGPTATAKEGDFHDGEGAPASAEAPVVSFDLQLDPSDPLSFLMNVPSTDSQSGDSSAEDSCASTSTPPSAHDSPSADWSTCVDGLDYPPLAKDESMDLAWAMNLPLFGLEGSYLNGLNIDFSAPGLGLPVENVHTLPLNPFQFTPTAVGAQALSQTQVQPYDASSTAYATPFSLPAGSYGQGGNAAGLQPTAPSAQHSRRLSLVSTSSSSAGTNSPVAEYTNAHPMQVHSTDTFIDELVERARQVAGITSATPASADNAHLSQTHPAKLPIPRLQRAVSAVPPQPKRKAASTASSSSSSPSAPEAPVTMGSSGRPKTSHTTIERRYRTNLNARIQSLRAAVPALRVLEQKDGNRVGNLSLKAGIRRGETAGDDSIDVIDERGFVDGVKVARKGSKANVLGKAVEYIRVLKRRELRLKREQDGLRALVASLEGGPALLQAWESMWLEKYGGPETDEVEGEEDNEADDEIDDDDDEEGEDAEEDGEGGAGKKRKRPKVEAATKAKKETAKKAPSTTATSSTVQSAPIPGQPEKRKRGRPRKNPQPAAPPSPTDAQEVQMYQMHPPGQVASAPVDVNMGHASGHWHAQATVQAQPQPGQYLLAAFAFFSFFNSPMSFTASSRAYQSAYPQEQAHTHSGSVLGARPVDAVAAEWARPNFVSSFGWRDVVQVVHLTVSFLLLVSIVAPWLPRILRVALARCMPRALKPVLGDACFQLQDVHSARPDANIHVLGDDDAALSAALRSNGSTEVTVHALRDALGLCGGLYGTALSVVHLLAIALFGDDKHSLEHRVLEQKAAMRLCELTAMNPLASSSERIQTYLLASKFLSIRSASPADLATLALVVRPCWRSKSYSLWDLAARRAGVSGKSGPPAIPTPVLACKPHVRLVLDCVGVDKAAALLATVEQANEGISPSPLNVLASLLVRERVQREGEKAFLAVTAKEDDEQYAVWGEEDASSEKTKDGEDSHIRGVERADIVDVVAAGHALGGHAAELVALYEDVCFGANAARAVEPQVDCDDEKGATAGPYADVRALMRAVALYRHMFPASPTQALVSASAVPRGLSQSGPSAVAATPSRASYGPSVIKDSHTNTVTSLPSPPPSPSRKRATHHLALRQCLDSAAFDRHPTLEDARDRVVDMLTTAF